MDGQIKNQRKMIILAVAAMAIFGLQFAAWNYVKGDNGGPNNNGNTDTGGNGGEIQDVYIRALSSGGYDKSQVSVKLGSPVRLHFSADSGAGCGKILVMRNFGVQLISRNGEEQIAQFTPSKEGVFEYSCSMRMFVGQMQVKA